MAKFCGVIGFAKQVLISPGVYDDEIIEKSYRGDVIRKTFRWEQSQQINDNLNINNTISIVADSFAYDNAYAMKYVEWLGARWEITSVEVQRPRLTLYLGGVYNGPIFEADVPSDTLPDNGLE